jgi:hypothetical protein
MNEIHLMNELAKLVQATKAQTAATLTGQHRHGGRSALLNPRGSGYLAGHSLRHEPGPEFRRLSGLEEDRDRTAHKGLRTQ